MDPPLLPGEPLLVVNGPVLDFPHDRLELANWAGHDLDPVLGFPLMNDAAADAAEDGNATVLEFCWSAARLQTHKTVGWLKFAGCNCRLLAENGCFG